MGIDRPRVRDGDKGDSDEPDAGGGSAEAGDASAISHRDVATPAAIPPSPGRAAVDARSALRSAASGGSAASRRAAMTGASPTSRSLASIDPHTLDDLAHELRGPLHGLLGMAELTLGGALEPLQRERVQLMRHAGEHLLALVDHVFGPCVHAPPTREPLRVRELLDDVMAWHVPLAASRGLQLSVRVAPEVPDLVSSDARRLRQLIVNLLQNAVRCTTVGAVEARAVMVGPGIVALEVADTGAGMPDAHARRLRARPRRDDARNAVRPRGLDIVARLVAELGAAVDVLARAGIGTCVRVTLPADAVAPHGGRVAERWRVLVVDRRDDRRRRQLAALAHPAIEPYGASDALEALRLAALESIDAVVVADGACEVTPALLAQALRADRRWDGPVIAASAIVDAAALIVRLQERDRAAEVAAAS